MAALEDFENTLKEVVSAKRLSASKMNRLTEIAMKSLEDDTKLVAILYRTHKSLPNSAKVSSLYAFDALARAARSLVNKRGVTGDINLEKGNAATFLLKIEGVLDGLFQDMVSLDNSEAKEKTKKVHEIWVKTNTFPSAVLTRLRDILSDVRKENAVNPTPPIDPRTTEALAMSTTSQATLVPDAQATLLALLGQAAQLTGQGKPASQTPPNTDPQLQQTQLALLKQLALTAKLANGSPTPPPGQTPLSTDRNPSPAMIPVPEPSHSSSWPPQTGVSRLNTPGDTRHTRNGYPDRARDQRDFRDERHPRGGARGGYRGRGRWDDHHNQDRFRHRDRNWDPPPRPRRSRSRSPRRQEERRNVRAYSPPHRPLNDRDPRHQPDLHTPPTSSHGKDEFGRDIRASSHSPSRSMSVEDTQALAPMDSSVDPTAGVPPDYHTPVSDQLPSVAASTSAQSTETHTPSSASQQQPGLDQFDINTFDATAPSSWEALGNLWRNTYGYPPSQEELLQFVMTGSMAAAGVASGGFNGAQGGQWPQENWQEQGPRRGGRGRGNYAGGRGGHGNYRDGGGYANVVEQLESEPSCAIVLNGDDEPSDDPAANEQYHSDEQGELHDPTENAGQMGGRGGGGRMQRVGDKWKFVRE
ncbi:hypothetical protein J3R82DRAFT_2508 [Butyriboletus roseoflavus]|nr:hypothetical protein J3R82DRAFT_2508 [Butyriboletus roseoflavus]